jgi:hypothetical protein
MVEVWLLLLEATFAGAAMVDTRALLHGSSRTV